VVFDQRAEAQERLALRVSDHDRVRVPNRGRSQLHGLAADVERLRVADLDSADLHLDLESGAHARDNLARADGDPDRLRPTPPR
jgi:hypothetical protein